MIHTHPKKQLSSESLCTLTERSRQATRTEKQAAGFADTTKASGYETSLPSRDKPSYRRHTRKSRVAIYLVHFMGAYFHGTVYTSFGGGRGHSFNQTRREGGMRRGIGDEGNTGRTGHRLYSLNRYAHNSNITQPRAVRMSCGWLKTIPRTAV